MNYETHGGVTLKRVRVTRNVYFANLQLKATAGAVGLLASEDGERGLVTFEYHSNPGAFIALSGCKRRAQMIELTALEDA